MLKFRSILAVPSVMPDMEPEHCAAIVEIAPRGGAICTHDVTDHPRFHEGASPIHEANTGVSIRWLGTDRGDSAAYMLHWVDDVTGNKVEDNDPRLIPPPSID